MQAHSLLLFLGSVMFKETQVAGVVRGGKMWMENGVPSPRYSKGLGMM